MTAHRRGCLLLILLGLLPPLCLALLILMGPTVAAGRSRDNQAVLCMAFGPSTNTTPAEPGFTRLLHHATQHRGGFCGGPVSTGIGPAVGAACSSYGFGRRPDSIAGRFRTVSSSPGGSKA